MTGKRPKDEKENYDPAHILEGEGFNKVETKSFKVVEKYTIEEALTLSKSMSLYATLSDESKQKAITLLKEKCKKESKSNIIERPLEINVVKGIK